ncbi:MAG: CfrBI family restriction endonuclease [Chloroflexi bacterium]|nr:CfrBI family restriction endonuclease [Chloroflexota bacterium]
MPNKAEFAKFCIEYFKQIARSKFSGVKLTEAVDCCDLDDSEPAYDRIIFGTDVPTDIALQSKDRVIAKVPIAYPDELPEKIPLLVKDTNPNIEYKPVLNRNGVSIELTLQETLIVVNTLAAKHSEIRGGAWSGLGKRLELPLMLALAKLYQVPTSHYAGKGLTGENREVDFHFLSRSGDQFFCEVKLMGKGNPESADSTIARRSNIFIAQTLSEKNKSQLTNRGHHWVELGAIDGYKRIFTVFTYLDIPCVQFDGDLDSALDSIIPQVFEEIA